MLGAISKIFSGTSSKGSGKFNLTEFASEMGKTGFARPAYFMVVIIPPTKIGMQGISASLPLRIESAELPGRSMLSTDQTYYGPMRKIPYRFNATPITLSVILSEDYREREFFQRWQDLILGGSRLSGTNPDSMFDVGYYDDYTKGATVELHAFATSPAFQGAPTPSTSLFGQIQEVARSVGFDPSMVTNPLGLNLFGGQEDSVVTESLKITLVEPYPETITPIAVNWADGDAYGKLSVQMVYRYYYEKSTNFQDPSSTSSLAGMLRQGVNAFNRFKPVLSLVKGQGIGGAARASTGQIGGGARAAGVAGVTF